MPVAWNGFTPMYGSGNSVVPAIVVFQEMVMFRV
jgi:hypothetical protein